MAKSIKPAVKSKSNTPAKPSAKATKTTPNERNNLPIQQPEKPYEPSELVIKEIMVQKGVTREQAIHILKNPSK